MNAQVLILLVIAVLLVTRGRTPPQPPPPPPGQTINDIIFDTSSIRRLADGSDNWNITSADDGHQYTAWGDGGGNGSSGSGGSDRVGLGVARIEGDPNNYRMINVNGGKNHEARNSDWSPTSDLASGSMPNNAKAYGIISIAGVLYMWVIPGSLGDNFKAARLFRSTNHARTWSAASWDHRVSENLTMPTFLQMGRDHANSDGSVYSYWIHPRDQSRSLNVQKPGTIYLSRAPQGNFFASKGLWEWWNGSGWGNISQRVAVPGLGGPEGVGWCISACYHPGFNKVLFVTEYNPSGTDSSVGRLRFYESPAPWGPFRVIKSINRDLRPNVFYGSWSPKWFSGNDAVLVFTGINNEDAWHTVKARFVT